MSTKENNLIKLIQMERSKLGARLFRNNVGQFKVGNRIVCYGLTVGSSDLIGWTPLIVTTQDVGRKLAIFTAIEIKTKGTPATKQQENFIRAVQEAGGIGEIIYEN